MFGSFFLGGFECSSHRRPDGRRLDLTESSGHAVHVRSDYLALLDHGISGARDGLRWYLIETSPHRYDWSSALPMLRAARELGLTVAWDLCHYGWPDDIDIWSSAFVDRFARFAAAAADVIAAESGAPPIVCPINEMSFWAWAGGEVARMNPGAERRGVDLKRQLVRATVAAVEAIRARQPEARFLYAEPAIHVDGGLGSAEFRRDAENYRLAQFEAFDMVSGRMAPELGGRPEHLDVVGVNYYPDNQWYLHGSTIPLGHHAYRPFSDMLLEVHARYERPMIVAETGAEGRARPAWLHYVAAEVLEAMRQGARIEGICLYPIHDYHGWANDRLCSVGLFSVPDRDGKRTVFEPLAEELRAQQGRLLPQAPVRAGRAKTTRTSRPSAG